MIDSQYFFVRPQDVYADHLVLRDDESQHCVKVLRKTPGDRFYAIDGLGHEFTVALEHSDKTSAHCRILSTANKPRELGFEISLVQALIKKDHFDLVVEKVTELGVHRIIPVKTRRSLPEAGHTKIERWHKIALTAMKQSRRSLMPEITPVSDLNSVLRGYADRPVQKIFLHESSEQPLDASGINFAKACDTIIVVGPEGGFTDEEAAMAAEYGFQSFSLGLRRLRAETASICGVGLFSMFAHP